MAKASAGVFYGPCVVIIWGGEASVRPQKKDHCPLPRVKNTHIARHGLLLPHFVTCGCHQ